MTKPREWLVRATFIILLTFCVVKVLEKCVQDAENNIAKNKKVILCTVVSIDFFPRGDGLWFNFQYQFNNKTYDSRERVFIRKRDRKITERLVLDKKLILFLDSTDLSNCKLPITEREFNQFNFIIPDSLNGIYNDIRKLIR